MAEMSVIWLRVAAALYSVGLLHAILTLIRKRENLFRVALGAFSIGAVLHFVSIIEEGLLQNRCPIANFYETLSMCAFLVTLVFLFVYWRYKLESLSVFVFPLVFVMTLVATMGNPGERLDQPGGAQCLAYRAYRPGSARLCGTADHGRRLPALPVPGARTQTQEAAQILLPPAAARHAR